MKDEILKVLDEKVNEVYLHFQEKLDIRDGAITPMQLLEQDEILEELAKHIENVLNYEMEEIDYDYKSRE